MHASKTDGRYECAQCISRQLKRTVLSSIPLPSVWEFRANQKFSTAPEPLLGGQVFERAGSHRYILFSGLETSEDAGLWNAVCTVHVRVRDFSSH